MARWILRLYYLVALASISAKLAEYALSAAGLSFPESLRLALASWRQCSASIRANLLSPASLLATRTASRAKEGARALCGDRQAALFLCRCARLLLILLAASGNPFLTHTVSWWKMEAMDLGSLVLATFNNRNTLGFLYNIYTIYFLLKRREFCVSAATLLKLFVYGVVGVNVLASALCRVAKRNDRLAAVSGMSGLAVFCIFFAARGRHSPLRSCLSVLRYALVYSLVFNGSKELVVLLAGVLLFSALSLNG